MQQTTHTPDTLRTKLAAAIQRDIKAAKNYLKICRQYISQADNLGDNETAVFWANQYDKAAQQVQALNYQLKTV